MVFLPGDQAKGSHQSHMHGPTDTEHPNLNTTLVKAESKRKYKFLKDVQQFLDLFNAYRKHT